MEINICRLCLNLVKKDFEVIDEVTRQTLEVILSNVDLNVSQNPILCKDCGEITRQSYFFKLSCNDTEDLIHSFCAGNSRTELDMKDVYRGSKDTEIATNDYFVCRFCMNRITRNFVSIDILMKDTIYMEMLPRCVQNKGLNIIKDPVICTHCRTNLECYFKFTRNCLDTEEKINKYRHSEGINSTSQIELKNVLHFLFKDTLESPDKSLIKQENTFEYIDVNTDSKIYNVENKSEELIDIKNEDTIVEDTSCKSLSEMPIDKGKKRKDASNVEVYKCGICIYESKHKRYLKKHILTHKDASEVEMHKCTICTYETKYKDYLKKHMVMHKDDSEVEMHQCTICTYETKYKDYLRKHMVTHKDASEVEMHKCTLCTYETKYKNKVKIHMLKHKDSSEVEMYKCGICTHETKYKNDLKVHRLKHITTASAVEMYKCAICTFETKYKRNLRVHVLKHKECSEVVMYKCAICTYETRYKHCLKDHTLMHKDTSDVEMHKCGTCAFETKYKKNLKIHMLKHKPSELEMYKEKL